MSTLRHSRWPRWIQILTVLLWSLFPPFFTPASWEPDATGQPVWTGAPEDEPPEGPDEGDDDGDGLPNWFEDWLGSDRYNPDTDYDGISDYDELYLTGTDPLNWDSDFDGYSDHDAWHGCWAVNHYQNGFGHSVYDWDGDGLYNHEDPWPFDAGNGEGETDSDGDGVPDAYDSHPHDPSLWNDWNHNGVNDEEDDDDNDGVPNGEDSHPDNPSLWRDWDGNGYNDDDEPDPNADDDNDGVPNGEDSHPDNPNLWCDWNNNGHNDDDEPDDDNDGVPNCDDSHPANPNLWCDWNHNGVNDDDEPDPNGDEDGDGYLNSQDSHPLDPDLWSDWNHNGLNYEDEDADGDGHSNGQDSHPHDPYLWNDWDDNGTNDEDELDPDGDEDNDGVSNGEDSHPWNPLLWNDRNHNGVNDEDEGPDSDGDGHGDNCDSHPDDPNLWCDWNNNGINDNEESSGPNPYLTDSDGDGVMNAYDSHPHDSSLWDDWNNNGINDHLEGPQDSDGDGVIDPNDSHPHNASLWSDWDHDGLNAGHEQQIGTNPFHPDSDGDGLTDGEEVQYGTNPLARDTDDDGLTDFEELRTYQTSPTNKHSRSQATGRGSLYTDWEMVNHTDSDGDGIPDRIERLYGLDPNNPDDAHGDLDGDGTSNLQAWQAGLALRGVVTPLDRDGDGITDIQEDYWSAVHRHSLMQSGGAHPARPLLSKFNPDDAVEDPDGDDLMNWQEILLGSNPMAVRSTHYNGLNLAMGLPQHVNDRVVFYWSLLTGRLGDVFHEPLREKIVEDLSPYLQGRIPQWGNGSPGWQYVEYGLDEDDNPIVDDEGNEGYVAQTAALGLALFVQEAPASLYQARRIATPANGKPDYDGDGLPDTWEWKYRWSNNDRGLNPLDPRDGSFKLDMLMSEPPPEPDEDDYSNAADFAQAQAEWQVEFDEHVLNDPDGDRLSNYTEFLLHSHPLIQDTDGDGIPDGLEFLYGSSATNATSLPPVVLQIESGLGQIVATGGMAPEALVVRALLAGQSRPGVTIEFSAGSGEIAGDADGPWLSTLTRLTDASGQAGVLWRAPETPGDATITASTSGGQNTATFQQTAQASPPTDPGGTGSTAHSVWSGGPDGTLTLLARTRRVYTTVGSHDQAAIAFSGRIAIEGMSGKRGWFLPNDHKVFSDAGDLQSYLDDKTEADPDWTGVHLRENFGEHIAIMEGDWINIPPLTGYIVTVGTRADSEAAGFYGAGWQQHGMDVWLMTPEEVRTAVNSGGRHGTLAEVLGQLGIMHSGQQLPPEARHLPARSEEPFYVYESAIGQTIRPAMLHYSTLTISDETSTGDEGGTNNGGDDDDGDGGTGPQLSARFLTGDWHEYWLAREAPPPPENSNEDPPPLPRVEQTWLRVTERFLDESGNSLPAGVELETLQVEVVTLVMEEDELVSTETLINGQPGGGPNAGVPSPPGAVRLTASEIGVRQKLVPLQMGVYPIPDEDESATYRVSADQRKITLSATIYVPGESGQMQPAADGSRVKWTFDGSSNGGSFDSDISTVTNGFTSTRLITSTDVGTIHKVRCNLLELHSESEGSSNPMPLIYFSGEPGGARAAPIEVVPGLAAASMMTHSPSELEMPADGKSEREITVVIKDKYGHIVHEGTPVTWHLKGLGTIKSRDIQTNAAGHARATIVAGTVPGEQILQVLADAALYEVEIENTALNPTVTSSPAALDASYAQLATITANFPGAANGSKVVWHSTRGRIVNADEEVSGGQATAQFLSEPGPDGTAFVSATVGSTSGWARIPLQSQGPLRVTYVSEPVLAANATGPGQHGIKTASGATMTGSYAASTQISLHLPGRGGQTVRIGFGKRGLPGGAHFGFDSLAGTSSFEDNTGQHQAAASGVVLDDEISHEGAGAAKFSASGNLTLAPSPAFQLRPGFQWQSWVRPDELGGDLIYQPGQYRLLMDSGGALSFTVWTSQGEHTITLPQHPLVVGEWQRVSVNYLGEEGGILLSVGEATAQAAALGEPDLQNLQSPVVGSGFAGSIDEMSMGVEDSGVGASVLLSTGLPNDEVQLDEQGRATITATSTGLLDSTGGAAQEVDIHVLVDGEPVQSVPRVITAASSNDIARAHVMVEALQSGEFSEAERAQIVASKLGNMVATGQRSDAANLPAAGNLANIIEGGYQMSVFISGGHGSLGDGAYLLRVIGEGELSEVQQDYLRARIAQFAAEAARQGSDTAAQRYARENEGKLIEDLAGHFRVKLSHEAPFVDTVEFGSIPQHLYDQLYGVSQVIDSQEAFEDFNTIAEKDPDLLDDLLECAKKSARWASEAARQTGALIADGYRSLTAPLDEAVKWKNKAIESLEDFIKKSVEEGLADGSISEGKAFNIGATWGAVRQLTDMLDLVSPEVAGQMISSLTGMVVGAIKGDEKSQEALAEMAPLVGTWKAGQEVESLKNQGKHFEAGMKFTEFAVSSVEDTTMVYGVATVGVASGVVVAVKVLRRALKHARPPRGALSPRHLPNFTPNEVGPSYMKAEKGWLGSDPMPSAFVEGWKTRILQQYDGKVRVEIGPVIDADLTARGAAGTFKVLDNGEAVIKIRRDATKYVMKHELKHADHFKDLGYDVIEWRRLKNWEGELEAFRRLKMQDWSEFNPMETKHGIHYVRKTCLDEIGIVPQEVMDAIAEWVRENPQKSFWSDP